MDEIKEDESKKHDFANKALPMKGIKKKKKKTYKVKRALRKKYY